MKSPDRSDDSHVHRWKLSEGIAATGRCACGAERDFSGGAKDFNLTGRFAGRTTRPNYTKLADRPELVAEVRRLRESGEPLSAIVTATGVSKTTIRKMLSD